jgi:hypothetical protein
MSTEKMKKNETSYCCKLCDFNTSKKTNYELHLQTHKHIRNSLSTISNKKNEKNDFTCNICNKIYSDRSGLWRHKNKDNCSENQKEEINVNNNNNTDLIMMLINDNKELRNLLLEQCKEKDDYKTMILEIVKKDTYNTTNNTNISNNNKSFNLNVFLNETCKDAMNIMDFVESIKLQISDLERVGELGYVEGISKIIIKSLKELDVSQRPVHCTDKKREIIYIKDEDKWEKDEEQKKMHKIVRKVADKNARMILKYKEVHPDCGTYHSKFSDQYNKIIVEAMGGSGDNDFEKEEKIIRNVAKQIGIEKE